MPQHCPHCQASLPAYVDAFCPECRERVDEPPPRTSIADGGVPDVRKPPSPIVPLTLLLFSFGAAFNAVMLLLRGGWLGSAGAASVTLVLLILAIWWVSREHRPQ